MIDLQKISSKVLNQIYPKRWFAFKEKGIRGLSGERLNYFNSWDRKNGIIKVRHAVVPGGRRSYKTEIAKRQLVLSLPERKPWDDPRYFFGAPTFDQAKRVAWKDLKKLVPPSWTHPTLISESDLCIRTWWGAELWVFGLDKPERVEGLSWDGCVLDERADLKPGAWKENISPALADREGWSRHIGVPDYKGPSSAEFKELFEYALLSGDPNWKAYTWKSTEVLSDKIILEAKRELPSNIFRQEYEATFEGAPGRAYWEFDKSLHVRPTSFIEGLPIHVACDFNAEHHNWGMYQRLDRGVIASIRGGPFGAEPLPPENRIFDEVYLQDARVEQMCTLLKDKLMRIDEKYLNERGTLFFYGDYAGNSRTATATKTAWNQIRDEFPNARFLYRKQPLINDRIDIVNGAFRNALEQVSVSIDPKCKNHIRDFEYVTRTMLFTQNKSGDLSHASDCFGYFLIQYRDAGKSDSKSSVNDLF